MKITLNWLIFLHFPESCKTTMTCQGLSSGTKGGVRDCTVWEGYGLVASEQNKQRNKHLS
jgi:hypothetical protein